MDRWENKVAVVTGASSEIGLNIARHLVHSGLNVVGLARRREELDELARNLEGQNGKFYSVKFDITNEEDISSAFKWITENVGIAQILVNCQGIRPHDTSSTELCFEEREIDKIMTANHVDGHIIHISSIDGNFINDWVSIEVYRPSKSGVTITEIPRPPIQAIGSKIKYTIIKNRMVLYGLSPDDTSQAVLYALGTPPHVQVNEIIISPFGLT